MSDLADSIEALAEHREPWYVAKEPHGHPDGTTHFTHVHYDADISGTTITVKVASHVTPELGELLCVLHNNIDSIVAALRQTKQIRETHAISEVLTPLISERGVPLNTIAIIGEIISLDAQLRDYGQGATKRTTHEELGSFLLTYDKILQDTRSAVAEFSRTRDRDALGRALLETREKLNQQYGSH